MTTETEVRTRPILFSAPMIRAILAGQKTMTRRIAHAVNDLAAQHSRVKLKPSTEFPGEFELRRDAMHTPGVREPFILPCPYGKPGERLWVKETWAVHEYYDGRPGNGCGPVPEVAVECKESPDAITILPGRQHRSLGDERGRWRSSRFMPRWASRITLEITDVRVERVQSISEEDAEAEGVERECSDGEADASIELREVGYSTPDYAYTYQTGFERVWKHINGPESWTANPWVWVISFRRINQ